MKAAVLIVLVVVVIAIPLLSQAPSQGRAQFEVASVKVHPPPITQVGIANRGGRFVSTGFSLKMLVARGYAVPESRIAGLPAWAESERYDIEAKAPETSAPGQLQQMIQTMLEDRFQLKVHKETRELPVYDLTVPRNGSKLKLSTDQTPPPPLVPVVPSPGAPRQRGSAGFGITNGRFTFEGSAIPISMLVNSLQQRVDRPVIDKTGLTGLFDIKLEWVPGAEAPPLPFSQNPDAPPPPPVDGPSIFTAIQEQLGLRLEGAKGPLEVIVIDSAQRPAEN
jgi:uncharacterized protein (TIGR03435 family)